METLSSYLHVSGCDVRDHVSRSLQEIMPRDDCTEEPHGFLQVKNQIKNNNHSRLQHQNTDYDNILSFYLTFYPKVTNHLIEMPSKYFFLEYCFILQRN